MVTTRKMKTRVTSASSRRPPSYPVSPVTKFLKLILPSTLNSKMMKIPSRFVKIHGSKLSKFVTLKTPVGFERSIQLKRIGEEIWFQEGWIEFAEAHSIAEGHLLMFEFNGKSTFRVVIFDVTAAEIKYPFDEDKDVEIIDNSDDSDHKPKKRTSDFDFQKILIDIDAMDSREALKEDKRVFRGKQSF